MPNLPPLPPPPSTDCIYSDGGGGGAGLGCCLLPNGSRQMMTEANCVAAGGIFQGAGVQCPPPSVGTGNGNLLYVTTLKGLSACFNAYGTNGSDGNAVWANLNGIAPNNISGNSAKIRRFNLDPYSHVVDQLGTHLTVGWAMTDDGLYKVTGLPLNPVWTRKLSVTQARNLVNFTIDPSGELAWNFALSIRKQNFIAVILVGNTGFMQSWNSHQLPNYGNIWFTVYSLDGGETWQCDNTKWSACQGTLLGRETVNTVWIEASQHLNDVYFLADGDRGPLNWQDEELPTVPDYWTTIQRCPGYSGGTFPKFSPGMADGVTALNIQANGEICIPYADKSAQVYSDDNHAYLYGAAYLPPPGIDYTRRILRCASTFSPLWAYSGYTPPTLEQIGDALMTAQIQFLFTRTLNENHGVAIDPTYIWFSENLAIGSPPTWVRKQPSFSARLFYPKYQFLPATAGSKVAFFTGYAGSGQWSMEVLTTDFGSTFSDFSKPGQAGGLDTIMGLTSSTDMLNSQIIADRFYDTEPVPVSGGHGVDVSHYQGTMNWATAFSAGITFAFMKATQGSGYTDPQFATNWSGALAAGINRGPYHYFENATDPTLQANHFVAIATSGGELGYAVDCEDESISLDPANLKTFLDRVETLTGQKCIIYTRASWWNSYVGFQGWAKDYPLWVANWNVAVPHLPDGWPAWSYWQYSSQGVGSTYGAQSSLIDLDKAVGA